MQRDKIMSALLACYMGMVIVSIWAEPIKQFFEGKKTIANTWIDSGASPATIKIILFLIIVSIVAAKADISVGRDSSFMAPLETLFYSAITGIIISATIFNYLPEATQTTVIAQTKLIHYLKDYYTLWLLAPVVIIVVITSRRRNY